ncbi:gephyrin-like molybdotransferase Glp [Haloarcula pelagica]|uniref:molybdopterin molybdotransferase MoeA n=1 Tax=Haloarcula pelagica TaxID=3033389 RepID=UPI0024C3D697|nr:gephyrin-like molybdotransferase Glp [Halomicroarcula sp. YJ-61-S]
MHDEERRTAGFKRKTRVEAARSEVHRVVSPLSRTERVPVRRADERVLATGVDADRPVPHYRRAAMDGYAVRATDTHGASERSPVRLAIGERAGPQRAVSVHTGSLLPEQADAVVRVEGTERNGDEVAVFTAVASGTNVGPVGEDVAADQHLYDAGTRLRPSDLGLLKGTGYDDVLVYERPRVSVIPTGEELVQDDPDPGEIVETNGQTVAQYVERWGGVATDREIVTDDTDALRAAIDRDTDHDVVVTTGGSSVGDRDLLPEVVDDLGEVLVHGVALQPGHPVALGVVDDTPVLNLPGYPVACIVTAVQFLRPVLKRVGHLPVRDPPTTTARLARKLTSEPGTRSYVRVELDEGETEPTATPIRSGGAGVLSSVALADGWVVVPESTEGYAAGETVEVEYWEWSQ